MTKVTIDLSKCAGHGACVDVCPAGVFEMKDGKAVVVNEAACIECRACEEACPEKCITVTSE
ncbi:4Fe-4S binding protein [Candidatus Woesearchaeota archaeon]|nr:4Fe-4S binding protein [Candidatus Woesearchaeota archaeon]